MKNVVILILVAAALFFGGKWAWEEFGGALSGDDAVRRVEAALGGMTSGGDEQAAASMFLEGVLAIADEGRLEAAWDRWMKWRREKGYGSTISSYEVGDVDVTGEVPVVNVRIDGRSHRIAAPPGEQLRWAD